MACQCLSELIASFRQFFESDGQMSMISDILRSPIVASERLNPESSEFPSFGRFLTAYAEAIEKTIVRDIDSPAIQELLGECISVT